MKLNLGCGSKPLKGYVNIDAPLTKASDPTIKANIYSRIEDLKFDKESIESIKMEAVFEHFPRHRALFLLRRFYKWLQKDGQISILVPDLIATVEKIKTVPIKKQMFYIRHIFGPQDVIEYGTHYDGFTVDKLKFTFSSVGFNDFKSKRGGKWPSIYFIAIKREPFTDDSTAWIQIINVLKTYTSGKKSNFLIKNWLEQCKDLIER